MSTPNLYRRFTWFFRTEGNPIQAVLDAQDRNEVPDERHDSPVLAFKLYQKSLGYFLLVDTEPNLDYPALLQVFAKDLAFKRPFDSLMTHGVNSSKARPLERIYKLDQKVPYAATKGQLNTSISSYRRFVWTLLLEDDPVLIAEYKRIHGIGMAWPEITSNMKTVGVKDMEIYLHESQAILIMDTHPDFSLEDIGPKWQQLPREQEWQEYVGRFQRTDPNNSIQEKWKEMVEVPLTPQRNRT